MVIFNYGYVNILLLFKKNTSSTLQFTVTKITLVQKMCIYKYNTQGRINAKIHKGVSCTLNQVITLISEERINIPTDDEGLCIFHSKNHSWKRENGFGKYLDVLLNSFKNTPDSNYELGEITFPIDSSFKIINHQFDKVVSFSGSTFGSSVKFMGVNFNKGVDFGNAIFENSAEFVDTNFLDGVSFTNCNFKKQLTLKNGKYKDLDLSKTRVKGTTHIEKISVEQPVYFNASFFDNGFTLLKCTFQHFAFFDNSTFSTSSSFSMLIRECEFYNQVDFTDALFNCIFTFEDVKAIGCEIAFVNTKFNFQGVNTSSISNLKGTNFLSLTLDKEATVNFIGKSDDKLFNHEVVFFKENINSGYIRFENANFKYLDTKTRERFLELSKIEDSKIIIGSGCFKYKYQTDIIQVSVRNQNQDLVQELTNAFSSYFNHKGSFNLGVEFVSRTPDFVKLFYFTDEDISEKEFLSRFDKVHFDFWSLIGNKKKDIEQNNLPAFQLSDSEALVNLQSLLYKCKLRSDYGSLEHGEIIEIINSLNVLNTKLINPSITINVINENYSQKTLFSVNSHQKIVR
jgi:hypothetical protein